MNQIAFAINSTIFPPAKYSSFGQLATNIIMILTALAGSLSLMFIVIAGIKFVTSSGDPKNIASARQTLTYAIIGLAVTILAFAILKVVQYFLKSSVPIS